MSIILTYLYAIFENTQFNCHKNHLSINLIKKSNLTKNLKLFFPTRLFSILSSTIYNVAKKYKKKNIEVVKIITFWQKGKVEVD